MPGALHAPRTAANNATASHFNERTLPPKHSYPSAPPPLRGVLTTQAVATGLPASLHQPLQESLNTRSPGIPACANANAKWHAVTPEPHITINYRGDRLGSESLGKKMPPIGWTVDEIILMESIVGKTTHVEHGRWRLRGDAG